MAHRIVIWLLLVACMATARANEPWQGGAPGSWQLTPGLRMVRVAWTQERQRGTLCALFADLQHYEVQLRTASADGGRRRPQEWIEAFGLVAVINAAMFQPNGRSTALMIDGPRVNNAYDHPSYEGYLAFGNSDPTLPPLLLAGRDCADFDLARIRAGYRTIIQDYRLLDCERAPIAWRDQRSYPATAIGLSANGELVFVHSGGALSMGSYARLLREQLDLQAALFTEGGPQAALSVRLGQARLELGGVGEGPLRSLPLVLGLRAR